MITSSQDLAMQLYQSLQSQDKPRPMNSWHASSIAKCPREQYFMRKGVPFLTQATGAKILRWGSGHLIEEMIRPHLQNLMPNLTSNVRLDSKQYDLTGEYDNYDPDSKTIWEIKSVSSHAVRYRKAGEDRHHLRDDQPYLHHEWQEHAYVLLMREQGIEVNAIGYLYITLDGLLVPYLTPVKDDILADVEIRLAKLNLAWQRQEPPECICLDETHKFYKGTMQYCSYRQENDCCSLELLK